MNYQQFLLGLTLTTFLAVAGIAGMSVFFSFAYALPIIIGIGVLLFSICVIMFWLGKRTANAENKQLFSNVFLGVTGLKMFSCAGALFAYIIFGKPQDALFVLPVFFLYIVYTILEVVALLKLSRETRTGHTPLTTEAE